MSKGSIGHAFAVRIRTENQDQASFCPFALREVSVLAELALGHLRYLLTDVPPQSNSPPDSVLGGDRASDNRYRRVLRPERRFCGPALHFAPEGRASTPARRGSSALHFTE